MNIAIKADKRTYEAEIAQSFFEHMKGLMFSRKKNILFVLETKRIFGIHAFFVFFPFDAIYLDEKKKVVDVVRGIMPFTAYVENRKPAKYLLELIEKNDVKIGDTLGW